MAYPYVDKKILVIKAYCIRVSDLANADIDRLLVVCFNKHILFCSFDEHQNA
jgi:hypothetical protein